MRLVLVDDWAALRELWRVQCGIHLDDLCEIVGEAGDGIEAVACILQTKPDCVVLDLELPEMDGFGVMAVIRRKLPAVRFLVVSSHCTPWAVSVIRRIGVAGFVDKQAMKFEVLARAMRSIAAGGCFFSDKYEATVSLLQRGACPILQRLSLREIELLAYFSRAQSDSEIAERLGIAELTVKTHRGRILRKLDQPKTSALIDFAHSTGFAPMVLSRTTLKTGWPQI